MLAKQKLSTGRAFAAMFVIYCVPYVGTKITSAETGIGLNQLENQLWTGPLPIRGAEIQVMGMDPDLTGEMVQGFRSFAVIKVFEVHVGDSTQTIHCRQ